MNKEIYIMLQKSIHIVYINMLMRKYIPKGPMAADMKATSFTKYHISRFI